MAGGIAEPDRRLVGQSQQEIRKRESSVAWPRYRIENDRRRPACIEVEKITTEVGAGLDRMVSTFVDNASDVVISVDGPIERAASADLIEALHVDWQKDQPLSWVGAEFKWT